MHENRPIDAPERDLEAPELRLARYELLEQQCLLRDGNGLGAEVHGECFVAQREQARRLEADDGDAGRGERQQPIDERTDARPQQ